ncbi:MAG: YjgN family protein [Pseudomonadota bacterium]
MSQPPQAALPLTFTGSGSEYFRIWIVNLLLTIVTFGIYSAWAKVRRLKYFYQNTRLAGASFNYHGEPLAIFKGRLLALGLLTAWTVAPLDKIWGMAVWIVLAAIWPWIVVRSMRFKRRNSSYRNVRFRFDGRTRDVYLPFALLLGVSFIAALAFYPGSGSGTPGVSHAQIAVGVISVVLLLALMPHFHFVIQQFFATRTLFGETRFRYSARAWDFYKIYLLLGLVFFGGLLALGTLIGVGSATAKQGGWIAVIVLAIAGLVFFYGFVLFVGPYFQVRIQNLIWNNLKLGGHRFESRARVWLLFRITLVNLLLIALTLGFFRPFAVIRTLRYRIESVSLLPAGDLDSFVGSSEAAVAAFGAEAVDLFDFDLAL